MNPISLEQLHQQFPQFEQALLEQILQESVIRHLEAGDPVLQTGQYMRSSILLLHGLLKVYREDDEGNEFLMYYLEPGQACALSFMCTAREETSQVKVKAVQASDLVLVPQQFSEQWLSKYKSWHHFVIGSYRVRFEELLQTLDSIVFKSLDERLLFYLKRHVQVSGPEIKLSHQQIADDLNSSREVISRLLKKLEQKGALTLHRNFLEVHDLEIL
ncbi:Crp/Fnr family transcriptional regulator [Adhaeribacter sp. BT258]|uniref:Crp/Fnr family transcriptional regulator n=1 Tax=Adhaeribacter terrigena TaxID=2793070 RepID=A0ABS1BZS1_9BACT|nr:Crp/Fnr family transcriptional regulator [Adhaeribacter terrigena]MBK0402641.1 Crp/Fnr family transcriptional regulator [Adhaeribacter terrigena]